MREDTQELGRCAALLLQRAVERRCTVEHRIQLLDEAMQCAASYRAELVAEAFGMKEDGKDA